jgi:hypothetical protein
MLPDSDQKNHFVKQLDNAFLQRLTCAYTKIAIVTEIFTPGKDKTCIVGHLSERKSVHPNLMHHLL